MFARRKIVNILSYIVVIILLIFVFSVYVKKNELDLIFRIDLISLSVLILFALVFYSLGGLEYYFLKDMYGFNLEKKDILLLPVAMNLWSFIVPIQGSAVFFMLFLRNRHSVKIVDSLSITVFLYLVTVFFAGLAGIVFSIYYRMFFSLFCLVSFLFLLAPFISIIVYKIFRNIPDFKIKICDKLLQFFKKTFSNMNTMWLNYKIVLYMLILSFIRMIITALWYMYIAKILGYHDVPFLSLLLLGLWMTVSLIIRFTPNNWGVIQIVSGLMFSLISLSPEQGIMISLVASAILTVVAFSLGVGANIYYFRKWNIKSLKEISL